MTKTRNRMGRAAVIVAVASLAVALLPAPPAHAGSALCDDVGHCVTAEGVRTGSGAACWATSSGPTVATRTTITCSTGLASTTASQSGNFAFVSLTGLVLRVCWTAEGYWDTPAAEYYVETSGCEFLPI
ncbi:MAG TPA: hypothetical protein VG318_09430 [Actinomycetota bacterium]|nr:hypothetical protein [Actinomycetota bacterium]